MQRRGKGVSGTRPAPARAIGVACENRGMPGAPLSITPEEARALRAARASALRAVVLLVLVAAAAIVASIASARGMLDPGALAGVLLLCAWWTWLLRRAPARWRAAGRDLARGQAQWLDGVAAIRLHRGIGLLAPSSHRLLLGERCFSISAAQARALREGWPVRARIAPASGVLLSVARHAQAGTPDAMPAAASEATPPQASDSAVHLSAREAELLQLIAAGHADKEIARRLGLEPATVRTYNSQLYARLGARRRTEAVARARSLGLIA